MVFELHLDSGRTESNIVHFFVSLIALLGGANCAECSKQEFQEEPASNAPEFTALELAVRGSRLELLLEVS